jgi:hypothetical protein
VPVALGQAREFVELRDAASPKAGELRLLLIDQGQSQVIAVSADEQRNVFEYPAAASSLAVGAEGEVALFFGSVSVDPPNEREPAVLIRSAAEPLSLPPWSTLKPASAPDCAPGPSDYRVLVRAARPWLKVVQAGNPLGADIVEGPMLALLRVNQARFCLEAVELGANQIDSHDLPIPTRLVARFGSKALAAKVGVTLGAEYRQRLSCELR